MDPPNNIPGSDNTIQPTEAQGINNETGNPVPNPSISAVSLTEERSNAQTQTQYNHRNPAVRRIMREAQEMSRNPDSGITAHPLEDNLFEWHFTIRGTEGTEFENGLYHGRIILPAEYPMKPPSIIMLTPNGRFETGVKICLSISSYHPETWRPSWSIRTALLALQSFMNTPSPGAIGSLDLPEGERRKLARLSIGWTCITCGPNRTSPIALPVQGPSTSTANAMRSGSPSAALRVFRTLGLPERELVDEEHPVVNGRQLFHDDRAGDVPRQALRDGPTDINEEQDLPLEGDEPINPNAEVVLQDIEQNIRDHRYALVTVVVVIIGIVVRRLWSVMF